MGGLIGVNETVKVTGIFISDLNTITGIGCFNYNASSLNKPSNSSNYGVLLQLGNIPEAKPGYTGSWIYQIAFENESDGILYRKRFDKKPWGEWLKLNR